MYNPQEQRIRSIVHKKSFMVESFMVERKTSNLIYTFTSSNESLKVPSFKFLFVTRSYTFKTVLE